MVSDKDFEFKFSSGKFLIIRDANRGFVSTMPTMRLEPTHGHREDLGTAIHEALHAEFPELTEDRVAKAEITISKFLWRLGYRVHVPKKRKKK